MYDLQKFLTLFRNQPLGPSLQTVRASVEGNTPISEPITINNSIWYLGDSER